MVHLLLTIFLIGTPGGFINNELEGEWMSSCSRYGRHGVEGSVVFQENTYKIQVFLFERDLCSKRSLKITMDGNYKVGEAWGVGRKFDHQPTRPKYAG
jgi:hypothetical protein